MKASVSEDSSIISVQYCTGYVDKQNQWHPGFNCTGQDNRFYNSTPLFCCGTSTNKYCCSTQQYVQLGYAGIYSSGVTYGTLLTVVLSTFVFAVMITVIVFVCCKKFWKSRENLSLELVDDQVYQNASYLTLNPNQLLNAYTYNSSGISVNTDPIQISSTPSSSLSNAFSQSLVSPSNTTISLQRNDVTRNNNLNTILADSAINTSSISLIDCSNDQTVSANIINNNNLNSTTYTLNCSNNLVTSYSLQNPHQSLIFCEPPPPYQSNSNNYQNLPSNESNNVNTNLPTVFTTRTSLSNDQNDTANILSTNNNLSNLQSSSSYSNQISEASNSYQLNNNQTNSNNLPTNIWSQRLLLALGNYRRDCIYPVVEQPRKKLCRTLSQ